jgi:MFS family permease
MTSSVRAFLELPAAVWLLCVGTVVNKAGTLVVPFMALYVDGPLQLGPVFATQVVGAYGAGATVASLMGGNLADRLGRRAVMLGSLMGSAALIVFLEHLRSPWSLVVGSMLLGLVTEAYRPASAALVADLVPPAQRPAAYALLYFSVNLGFSFGPVIAAELVSHSFHWLFVGDAVTSAVFAVVIALGVREGVQTEEARREGSGISLRAALAHMANDRMFMRFTAGTFMVGVVFMQHIATLPLVVRSAGLEPAEFGHLMAINACLIVLLQLPMTAFLQRFEKARTVALGALITGLGFGVTAFASDFWGFAAAIAVWTLGEVMQSPFMQTIVGALAPAGLRGRYMGVFGLSFTLATAVGSPLGGLVLAHAGAAWLWGGATLLGLAAAVLFRNVQVHAPLLQSARLP